MGRSFRSLYGAYFKAWTIQGSILDQMMFFSSPKRPGQYLVLKGLLINGHRFLVLW